MKLTLKTVEGQVAHEIKDLPDTLTCELCGNIMEFISEDIGYSCDSKDCILHVETENV